MKRRLHALLFALILICSVRMTVCAHSVPDLSQTGSVTVMMRDGGSIVAGGTLTLYRAGSITEDNGSYGFVPTEEFAGCGLSLENVGNAQLAEKLAAYAADQKLAGTTADIAEDGRAFFDGLELGLYLLVQNTAADGYYAVTPFLVSVPMLDAEGDGYLYAVDASPKTEMKEIPSEPENPGEPGNPDSPSEPGSPQAPGSPNAPEAEIESAPVSDGGGDDHLPQTGQLNWPVPVLALLGLILISGGWAIGKKKGRK